MHLLVFTYILTKCTVQEAKYIFVYFSKYVWKIIVPLEFNKDNRCFTYRPVYIYDHVFLFFSFFFFLEMFQTKVAEKAVYVQ
jgi:hypothetical protein